MPVSGPLSRASACDVARGLYLLKYVDAPSDMPPVARVTPTRGSVDIVAAPGADKGVLTRPGQVLVLNAQTDASFDITVTAHRQGGATDASFTLDLLDRGVPGEGGTRRDADQRRFTGASPPADAVTLQIGAHVSRRGDVWARDNEWVAGPEHLLPIEGLSVAAARDDIRIDVRVQSERSQGQWSKWGEDGAFVGSRQRADPITAVGLRLHGHGIGDLAICADVMHLGAPAARKVGREVEFFGYDAIVGFRLALIHATERNVSESDGIRETPRVFRGHR